MNRPEAPPVGLSHADAARRRARDGANILPEATRRTRWHVLRDVVREPMLLLLLSATALYVLLGDRMEASLLAASVIVVIGLTVYQSERTEHALRCLRELGAPRARVMREGDWSIIPASELVVEDVFEVGAGDRIPADGEVIAATDLQVDESMLTGESLAVDKRVDAGREAGRLYSATLVVRGSAVARVTAIGGATAVGRIGASLQSIRAEPGPIQVEIRRLVRIFAALAAAACLAVVGLHYWNHQSLLAALLAGITLAIAVVPVEFPVVLAIFTAIGARRLSRAHALVRRLSTLESMGAVDVLCTDKTGTLTENRMRVAHLVGTNAEQAAEAPLVPELQRIGQMASWSARDGSADPMDRALAERFGKLPALPVREYPFSASCPAAGQVLDIDDGRWLACKGAPEFIARLCALDAPSEHAWLDRAEALAQQGLRVLAVAEARAEDEPLPGSLGGFGMNWLGLVAFSDPLRAQAAPAVAEAQAAGIRVLMLTGDHVGTASEISRQAGIDAGRVLSGSELQSLDDAQLREAVERVSVFARVRPEDKLRLVRALRATGAVVAMTGDGVNDAPALAASHLGVAMGGRGTDVARETAGLVLLDDNFATIVRAIRMGRQVHDNLRRALRYIVSVHVPIAGMALLPLLLELPAVLLPLHLVLLQLVIDPACSVIFEREPEEPDLMRRPPEGARFQLFDRHEFRAALATGLAMFALVAAVYARALALALPGGQAAALAFSTLLAGNLCLIWRYRGCRSFREGLLRPNLAFLLVVVAALSILVAATRIPAVAGWFAFSPPPWGEWLAAVLVPIPLAAVAKSLSCRRKRRATIR